MRGLNNVKSANTERLESRSGAPNSSMTKGRPSAAAMALRVDSHARSKAKLVAGFGMLVATLLSSEELACR